MSQVDIDLSKRMEREYIGLSVTWHKIIDASSPTVVQAQSKKKTVVHAHSRIIHRISCAPAGWPHGRGPRTTHVTAALDQNKSAKHCRMA